MLIWAGIWGASFVLAFAIRFFLKRFALQLTERTSWQLDDVLVEQVMWKVVIWLPLFVVYLSASDLLSFFGFGNEVLFYVRKTILAVYILTITDMVVHVISVLLEYRTGEKNSSSSILRNIARVLLYVLAILLIVQNYGIQVYPILATLGIGGLAVALALQPTLSNLFSGLQIIASRKIEIGDLIELENGKKGIVSDISWRNTTITTWQNNVIIIPNSKIVDSIIENFNLEGREVLFNVPFGVAYGSDLVQVERVVLEVAATIQRTVPQAVADFEPFMRFQKFGDSSIDLSVFMKSQDFGSQFVLTSQFIIDIQKRFQQEGIEIPFPIRTVYLQK